MEKETSNNLILFTVLYNYQEEPKYWKEPKTIFQPI